MAIINSYPTGTPVSGDLLVGTDVSTTPNSTKTFTVGSVNALAPQGTVTSVALTAPAAFSVSGSPITSSGTIAITGAGSNAQFVDGTGALQTIANLPFIDGTGVANRVPFFVDADTISSSGLTYTATGGGSAANLPLFNFNNAGNADINTQRVIGIDYFGSKLNIDNIVAGNSGTVILNGNTVIGNANSDTLTVNATATFVEKGVFTQNITIPTTPSANSDAASKAYVDSQVGYSTYVARVTQSGTNAPVATVISNNTGLTFTWSRNSTGSYRVSPSSAFVVNKTWIQMTGGDLSSGTTSVSIKDIGTAFASAVNVNLVNGNVADNITAAFVEIRIYP